MENQIKKIAVIGSGVMGASIAAHVANAGFPVYLFDIVKQNQAGKQGDKIDKNALPKAAIQRMSKQKPSPIAHKKLLKNITPANLETDLPKLQEVDFIIEAVLEDIEVKHSLYEKISPHLNQGCIVASNTSTIPLAKLKRGLSDNLKSHFCITHFFNPPRYMRLLELITDDAFDRDAKQAITSFLDVALGKGVVECKDSAGFIANRIGCFWMNAGLSQAIAKQVDIEEADAVFGRPLGIPKTGIFGLMDLIGIDLLPLIAKSFAKTLPKEDLFLQEYQEREQITEMIKTGYTGRKGLGGFFKLGENKQKLKRNLQTGEYEPATRPKPAIVNNRGKGISAMFDGSIIGEYTREVLLSTLYYSIQVAPQMATDIHRIDTAMKLGYNWKYGVFELVDKLALTKSSTENDAKTGGKSSGKIGSETGDANRDFGTDIIIQYAKEKNLPIPDFLQKAKGKNFYESGKYLSFNGEYIDFPMDEEHARVADVKQGGVNTHGPILKNASAKIWDAGSKILLLEFTSKMNSIDPDIISIINKTCDLIESEPSKYTGLVIANDGDNFCVGANIGILLYTANIAGWKFIEEVISSGQRAFMRLKYAPFPVVCAPTGMALGGGCELLLHSDAVQAHIELYAGLVEVGVGLIPGWGGCKEIIYRAIKERATSESLAARFGSMFSFISGVKALNTMPAIEKAFKQISMAKVSTSAIEAQEMLILNEKSAITMNRGRLLYDAKQLCLQLAENYQPPVAYAINLPGKTAKTALDMAVKTFIKNGKASEYDAVLASHIGNVLTAGNANLKQEITEEQLLKLELKNFCELIKNEKTLARLEYMLENNKPLRN
jgi:3-hydroxyacyl-CoA dehydrogenase